MAKVRKLPLNASHSHFIFGSNISHRVSRRGSGITCPRLLYAASGLRQLEIQKGKFVCHTSHHVKQAAIMIIGSAISQSVASTRDLALEMESAGLEMQRALREAQDFLALEDRQDTNTEEQRQDTECEERDATITSNLEDTIDTFDVQSLLDEIAALKKSVQEANDEVTELKSALNTSLNNTASKADMDAKSPVDEVLCSKSTCDTTFITCSIRNCEEDQYGHEDNGTSSGADWEGEDRMEICGNICFLGKFANLILANTAHKKQMLMIP